MPTPAKITITYDSDGDVKYVHLDTNPYAEAMREACAKMIEKLADDLIGGSLIPPPYGNKEWDAVARFWFTNETAIRELGYEWAQNIREMKVQLK